MPRRVLTSRGVLWVDDDGSPLGDPSPGLGSLPGQALRRQVEALERLPHAQNAGYEGRSIVHNRTVQGAYPGDDDPPPKPTYRPLNGAAQNNRGNSILVSLPQNVSSSEIEVGSIVETPKNSGDDAESLLVVCGTSILRSTSGPNSFFKIDGLLTFGIGGASFFAEFDWIRGVSFSVPASYLRIAARITYLSAGGDAELALHGAMAYGPAPGGNFSALRRTLDIGTLIPGVESAAQTIPPFASALTLTSEGAGPPSVRVRVRAGTRIATFDVTNRSNEAWSGDGQFTLPGWAETFTLENTGVANLANVATIFSLAL